MNFTNRQLQIIDIIKKYEPITAEQIAEQIGVSRATIRSDLAILVMTEHIEAKPKVGYFIGNARRIDSRMFEKLEQIKVKDVQGVPVVIQGTTTIHDAVVTLFVEDVGSLIVVDEEADLRGIVSRKDLLKFTIGNVNATSMPVSMVMTRHSKVHTIDENASVIEAAKKLIHYEIDSLPVVVIDVEGNKKNVVGRITKTNIIKMLLDLSTEL